MNCSLSRTLFRWCPGSPIPPLLGAGKTFCFVWHRLCALLFRKVFAGRHFSEVNGLRQLHNGFKRIEWNGIVAVSCRSGGTYFQKFLGEGDSVREIEVIDKAKHKGVLVRSFNKVSTIDSGVKQNLGLNETTWKPLRSLILLFGDQPFSMKPQTQALLAYLALRSF